MVVSNHPGLSSLFVLVASLCVTQPASSQTRRFPGFLLSDQPFEPLDLSVWCLPAAEVDRLARERVNRTVRDSSCELGDRHELGAVGGNDYYAATFTLNATFVVVAQNTIGEASRPFMAVFEVVDSAKGRPIWYDYIGDALLSGRPPKLVAVDHRAILDIQYYTGGTGGFWQEFLLVEAQGLQYLQTDHLYDLLVPAIPDGYGIRKGYQIDIETMTGRAPLYQSLDPNCCASAELRFTLELEGDRLIPKNPEFRPN